MSYLDAYNLVSDNSRPFITVRNRSITFSKSAIEKLDFCPYVHMFVNEHTQRVAFQSAAEDKDAIPFYKEPKPGRSVLVRISDKKKADMILHIAKTSANDKGVRFYGICVPEERLIDFDLATGFANE